MHLQYCTVFLNISVNKWTWTVQIHVFKVQLYVHKLIEKNQNTFGDLIVLISSLISITICRILHLSVTSSI